MVQTGEHAALAIEALGELRVARQRIGQELERDKAVEMRLAGLEDEAHAAAPEQFEDLQLRKGDGEAFERGDLRGGGRRGFGSRGSGDYALGAKPLRRFRRHRAAALGTGVDSLSIHLARFLRQTRGEVTKKNSKSPKPNPE